MIARWWSAPVAALGILAVPGPTPAQEAEQVIVAAGRWAADRLPPGDVRLDPHRTGEGTDPDLADRLATAIGVRLGTLEDMRRCQNSLDPATCELGCDALLAVAAPAVHGDHAEVRVDAWHAQDRPRQPVARTAWDLALQRSGQGWQVVEARSPR